MNHDKRSWIRSSWIGISTATLLTAGMVLAADAQKPPATPLAGTTATVDYPDGSRSRADYQLIKDGAALPGARAKMPAAEIGALGARESQSKLAEGFVIKTGQTVRVMSQAPKLPAAKAAAGVAAAVDARTKLMTLHPVEYRGVPLAKGSDYLSIATEDGRLLATRQRNLPTKVDAVKPTVTDKTAVATARKAAAAKFGNDKITAATPSLEIWVDNTQQGRLAWTVLLSSESDKNPKAYRYWVAATGEPRVLHAENEIYHTHAGTASGTLWSTTPLQATVSRPLGELYVTRSTGGTALTGDDGRYAFTSGGGTATLSSTLSNPLNPNSVIQNSAGAVMSVSNSGTPANPIDLNFGAAGEFEFAQVTAFYWTNVGHRLAGNILLAADLPNLPTRVNINASCNAYWDGSSINFFRAGGGCPNTAYSDVVLHEYGHGVDARKGGILDGGYSEGFGDAMAILGTRQSCLGRDFFGAGTCLRPATAVILWPPAPGDGVHAIGRRYAGFTWELVQQLRNTYSEEEAYRLATELVMAAAAANPANIPEAVYLSFVADDTDSNLATCSPHFHELAAAADSRNIPRPANCSATGAGSPGSAGHFPWVPVKKVSVNSNILEINLHLDEPMEVHVSANTSARVASGTAPRKFSSGLYNQPAANVMWTNSLRDVTVQHTGQWVNFSTMIAMNLPAGNHTFYWKIWTSGGDLEFSGGTMFAEAFKPSATAVAGAFAGAGPQQPAMMEATTLDPQGRRTSKRLGQ